MLTRDLGERGMGNGAHKTSGKALPVSRFQKENV